jgi:hypothetical protein
MSQLSITTVYPLERLLNALNLMLNVISTTKYRVLLCTCSKLLLRTLSNTPVSY